MGEATNIEWCDHTWNPWIGCTKVSPGCANCYAEELMDHRYGKVRWGKGHPRHRTAPATFNAPYKWNRKARENRTINTVFTLSLGDVYDREVPDDWRTDLFRVTSETRYLYYLLLTKRPDQIDAYHDEACWPESGCPVLSLAMMPNVALGVSVEGPEQVWRLDAALEQRCKITFASCEPLLGVPELRPYFDRGLNWVIVGGESGAAARECHIEWVRDIVSQCKTNGVPVFVKQLGRRATEDEPILGGRVTLPLASPKGGDPEEWPQDLRVQEHPNWESILP